MESLSDPRTHPGGLLAMESFYAGWVTKQEQLLGELLAAPRDRPDLLAALASRVLAHYHEYYDEKARLSAADVLAVFSPFWLSPYERTFLWAGGWKPSLAFRLLASAVSSLSADRRRAVEELRRETAAEERQLAKEMASAQEAMAAPHVLGFLRARDGDAGADAVVAAMREIAVAADGLRARTVLRLVEILDPVQTVDFLAAAAQLHLRIRRWGADA